MRRRVLAKCTGGFTLPCRTKVALPCGDNVHEAAFLALPILHGWLCIGLLVKRGARELPAFGMGFTTAFATMHGIGFTTDLFVSALTPGAASMLLSNATISWPLRTSSLAQCPPPCNAGPCRGGAWCRVCVCVSGSSMPHETNYTNERDLHR